MTNHNKKTGNSFEAELCQLLSNAGYWAHNLAQKAAGQPFDVIAARGGKTYVIDCKVCEHDRFDTNRIEQNQFSAMFLWEESGNGKGWFALKLSDASIWMIRIDLMLHLSCKSKTINEDDIRHYGILAVDWALSGEWV